MDFGVTGAAFFRAAYLGEGDFAADPEGPRRQLRLVANIQAPAYYIVAMNKGLGITDFAEVAKRRMPISVMASTVGSGSSRPWCSKITA